jgi:type II secretory pathway component PulM
MSEYHIDDIGGLEILAQACAALDRAEQCAAEVDHDGCTIQTKSGLREHPALKGELANRAFICRSLQRLGINMEQLRPTTGRPPGWSA